MPSIANRVRVPATDLTGTAVFDTSVETVSIDQHGILIMYDPDEADGELRVTVEKSFNDKRTTDANSEWIQLGDFVFVAGVGTFTANEYLMASAGAGTKSHSHDEFTAHAYKIRVGARETFSGGGSDFGNAEIWLFSRSS